MPHETRSTAWPVQEDASCRAHGPSAADLAAIEAEWPVMAAELAVLDAEIAALSTAGGPLPLDWRRIRRAEHQALTAWLRLLPAGAAEGAPGAA